MRNHAIAIVAAAAVLVQPCFGDQQPNRAKAWPLIFDLTGFVNEPIIHNGQAELAAEDQGFPDDHGTAAPFKCGASWFKVYTPQFSDAADGKSTVSFLVQHLRGKLHGPDCAVVELTVDSRTTELIDARVVTQLGGEDPIDSGVVVVAAGAAGGPKAAAVAEAVSRTFTSLQRWMDDHGAVGGRLQLPVVCRHCLQMVLRHIAGSEHFPEGMVVGNSNPAAPNVSAIVDGKRRWISPAVFLRMGTPHCTDVPTAEFDGIPPGPWYEVAAQPTAPPPPPPSTSPSPSQAHEGHHDE